MTATPQPIYRSFPRAHPPGTGQRFGVGGVSGVSGVLLPAGRTLTVTFDVLDAAGNAITDGSIVLSDLQWEQVDATTNEWAISVFITGGVAATSYLIRFWLTLDGDALPFDDLTYRLNCAYN